MRSLSDIRRAYEAGFGAGQRDGREGRPVSLFKEQEPTAFGSGYVAGHQAARLGPQESWSDFIADLLREHDITHGTEQDEPA